MTVATVSQKGWVVIPADLRRKYRLQPGARVVVVDYGGIISLVPATSDPIAEGIGLLKGEDSLTAALLGERAREREREQ